MVSTERMNQLEAFVAIAKDAVARAEESRLRWIQLPGIFVDSAGKDIRAESIARADNAVLQWRENQTRAESLLGRAQAGENV